MARRLRLPISVMGRCSRPSGSKRTPIFMSGAVMRRMGRVDSESSPDSVTRMSHGARMPMSRRAVVPELPQFRGSSGCFGPFAPQPVMPPARLPSGCFSSDTSAPSARTQRIDERTSSESSTPVTRLVPSAIAENSTARCEMDLSPGTVMAPCIGPDSGAISVVAGPGSEACCRSGWAACWVSFSLDMAVLLRAKR